MTVHALLRLMLMLLSITSVTPVHATEAPVLPRFGDPVYLPVPVVPAGAAEGDAGRLAFESPPDSRSELQFFPGSSAIRRLVTTGGLRVAWRRGTQQIQALAESLIYERESADPHSPERLLLVGKVRAASPAGAIQASALTIHQTSLAVEIEARGGIAAVFQQQAVTADRARFHLPADTETPLHTGTLEGAVRLDFTLDGSEAAGPAAESVHQRPFFTGIELESQQIAISGQEFAITFDGQGLRTVEALEPATVRLTRLNGAVADDAATPQEVVIRAPVCTATFMVSELGTSLSTFSAPAGITLEYLEGRIAAASGLLDLGSPTRRLEFAGGVTVEQPGARMAAGGLELEFDPEGQVRLAATGRPTFTFESANFAPLAEVLGNIRPGGVAAH